MSKWTSNRGLSAFGLSFAMLAGSIRKVTSAVDQLKEAFDAAPWRAGMKRTRIGSRNGMHAARKRRNRVRNRIAARSRAVNRKG